MRPLHHEESKTSSLESWGEVPCIGCPRAMGQNADKQAVRLHDETDRSQTESEKKVGDVKLLLTFLRIAGERILGLVGEGSALNFEIQLLLILSGILGLNPKS